ncbi:hypothetical protein D1871_04135 [Nakamurella silvestris]|nr:hypothetical protein D1871_04135 [Nakamurella silvestris]
MDIDPEEGDPALVRVLAVHTGAGLDLIGVLGDLVTLLPAHEDQHCGQDQGNDLPDDLADDDGREDADDGDHDDGPHGDGLDGL